eukprot:TRINITY_DN7156_c0_g1_i1.p1 TRINITY_DN7156_c0_g1~~TRINITY_DN7156_c0_g1_i1.p1  ORF type:complete len:452 (-),score=73.63 TRINITY_DN7156_c0_g1_i1:286-1476(-)
MASEWRMRREPKSQAALRIIRRLDIFPKDKDEASEQSSFGAVVTIIGILLITFLMASEWRDFSKSQYNNTLHVNYDRGEKMKINIRILFLALPCDQINLDVSDRLGGEDVAVQSNVKRNIRAESWRGDVKEIIRKVPRPVTPGEGSNYGITVWNTLRRQSNRTVEECLPCYDASAKSGRCCNNCFQLGQAYLEEKHDIRRIKDKPQCQNTAVKEGCMISGFLEVGKVQGAFHIVAGAVHSESGARHHHHFDALQKEIGFNTSHLINSFSFGRDFPFIVNPLDEMLFIDEGLGQQQYFLQVVPTVYTKPSGKIIDTNQYSVTYQYSPVEINSEHQELPGVFFRYDISPIAIDIEEKRSSLAHFFTRISAIIGGVWVVIGVVYSVTNNFYRAAATIRR